jgi:hypothetical protein
MTVNALLLFGLGLMQNAQLPANLTLTLACGEQPSELVLTARNSGSTDTAVLFGLAFANGRWYEPRELIVELTRTGHAEPEDLVYNGAAGVAGRIDHWVVALPARAAFSLTLRSSDFASTTQPVSTGQPETLTVRLTGRPISSELNVDMQGMTNWRVWTDTARSNPLRLSDCSQGR